ncbi:hypothetical protein [uncultured Microscilla sp.]|uniref:hypothetical protein n=1 Tax=uncultured Microscilla sp. TaxID=432653 RepID=UPI0026021C19|nr:hypothetical protein [uncultured Microscilla sp.]
MENKHNLNINDDYTNFTNLPEFRLDVEAEMAEVDRLFAHLDSNSATQSLNQTSTPATTLNSSAKRDVLEINDSYTNYTSVAEFRIDVEAEMAEVDRLLGEIPKGIKIHSASVSPKTQVNSNNSQEGMRDLNQPLSGNTALEQELSAKITSLQDEVADLKLKLVSIEKIMQLVLASLK